MAKARQPDTQTARKPESQKTDIWLFGFRRFGVSAFRPAINTLNLGIFLLSVLTIVIVANVFGLRDDFRGRVDATKTRAYSLSPQTLATIGQLEGSWTIGLLVNAQQVDRPARKQVEEVLSRFQSASDRIEVIHVDPTDPSGLSEYERILTTLRASHREQIDAYEQALDDGTELFIRFTQFGQQQAPMLRQMLERAGPAAPQHAALQQAVANLGLLIGGADQILPSIEQARAIDESRPIPDYEGARSTLASVLAQSANTLNDIAIALEQLTREEQFVQPFESRAMDLAAASDLLRRLPEMGLSHIGEQMQRGNCAVIVGPNGATVIADQTLFPQTMRASALSGRVTMDTRFRGEQVFNAAIRTLLVGRMPRVVLMHAENRSLMTESSGHIDLHGVRSILQSSGFEVVEWRPGENPQLPTFDDRAPTVWMVVPPVRTALEATPAESALLRATRSLIADGQPMMLNVNPSPLHQYGQPGRWDAIAADFGIHVDTSRVILERSLSQEDRTVVQTGQSIRDFSAEHVIGRAVSGQQLYLVLPVVLKPTESTPTGVRRTTLASVEPHADRWIDTDDWNSSRGRLDDPDVDETFDSPIPVIAAAERPHPVDSGTQRAIVVGSGGWMLSFVADQVLDTGGQRLAQINPGNYELIQSGVLWLAGMDDLIAASPLSQDVARLRGLDAQKRRPWFWLIVVVLPVGTLFTGGAVWMYRRV